MTKRENDSEDIDVEKLRRSDNNQNQYQNSNNTTKGFIIRYELLAIIFALIVQTITAVQWGATVTTKLEYTQASILELKTEIKQNSHSQYTALDATKDLAVIGRRIDLNDQRISKLENEIKVKSNI